MVWETEPPSRPYLTSSNSSANRIGTSANASELGQRGGGKQWLKQVEQLKKEQKALRKPLYDIPSAKPNAQGSKPVISDRILPDGFPDIDSLDTDYSDRLFLPAKILPKAVVLKRLNEWSTGRKNRMGNVRDVEELLGALIGMNEIEERWVCFRAILAISVHQC